jgi:hypothetical protein
MIISHHLYFTRARIYDITRKSSQKEEKKGRRRGVFLQTGLEEIPPT